MVIDAVDASDLLKWLQKLVAIADAARAVAWAEREGQDMEECIRLKGELFRAVDALSVLGKSATMRRFAQVSGWLG